MVRVDIKSFFLGGTPDQLAHFGSEAFEEPLRTTIRDTIQALSYDQIVSCKHLPGRIWRVCL